MAFNEKCGTVPYTEFSPKTTLDHFNDGRQCALQQVIEYIDLTDNLPAVRKFCAGMLDTVLGHERG
jgi:hypothetical protein